MRIRFTQAGGFHPPAMARALEVDTETLSGADAAELARLAADAGVFGIAQPPPPPAQARDIQHYLLAVEDGPRQVELKLSDLTIPDQLQPLIAWLRRRARQGR